MSDKLFPRAQFRHSSASNHISIRQCFLTTPRTIENPFLTRNRFDYRSGPVYVNGLVYPTSMPMKTFRMEIFILGMYLGEIKGNVDEDSPFDIGIDIFAAQGSLKLHLNTVTNGRNLWANWQVEIAECWKDGSRGAVYDDKAKLVPV
ncbi:uncharacterized protein PAC_20011 [Phialocephala subalpina]|uniref:Uncharacterized protein n=1 Tax=Phialocephala subalpina TaxID=576137 RepID=A0A1L7XYN1_9HELO|nr:uncharacterized protein PAC_20011 [Phialocephala subalpina]